MKKCLFLIFIYNFGCLCIHAQTQLITNGNFSSLSSGWATSGNWIISSSFSCYNSATAYAYAGDANGNPIINEFGNMKQTVTIPANATAATLSFYTSQNTQETTTTTSFDYIEVYIYNSTGTTNLSTLIHISNLNASSYPGCQAYGIHSFNLNSFIGQTIQIWFHVFSDGGPKNTMFRVDDVSLLATIPSCNYSILPTSISPSSSSGSGSVSVTATAGCSWTAVSNNTSWLNVTSGASGSGIGTVNYSYTTNSSSSPRTGTITIAGNTFTVNQAGSVSCSYSIAPTLISPSSSSGNGTVTVTATAGCSWTAISNNTSWLNVTSGSNGTGNGTVGYSYTTNSSSSSRTGTIIIAGNTFTITQAGITVTLINGVDVYSGNGSINWPQVYAAGKTFAFVKATEGFTFNDASFNSNMTNGQNAGVVMGAYHFARPDNNTAANEASHFLSIAGSYIGNGFLPPSLDIEDPPAQNYLASHTILQLAQWINDWCVQVHNSSSIWPIMYVDRCHAGSLYPYYQNGTINVNVKLWIADYDNPAGSPGNYAQCSPWVGWPWLFQQYFAPGSASNNPSTGMDQDVFNGDATAFNNLISNSNSLPDIIPTASTESATPSTVGAGSNITAYASEDNIGTTTAASGTVVGLWLSSSFPLNTSSAVHLGDIAGFPSVPANSNSILLNNTVTIPSNTTPGTYYLYFWTDGGTCTTNCTACSGQVLESNECNNFVSVQIIVTAGTCANLTPYQPNGWDNKIVLSTVSGTTTSSSAFYDNQTIYIDWAAVNNGTCNISQSFNTKLYIDGLYQNTYNTASLNSNFYAYLNDLTTGPLSAGSHIFQIVVDADGDVSESNENDNSYSRTITVLANTCANLAPYQPNGWDNKIVLSTGTGTNTSASTFSDNQTIYIDWAAINNGTCNIAQTFYTKLYLDGVFQNTYSTAGLNNNFYASLTDLTIGPLTAGSHTFQIVVDSNGDVTESNESDNSYSRTITVTGCTHLNIVRINDASLSNPSIISAANASAAIAAFDYAAAQFSALYSDPITITISLKAIAGTGTLGSSNHIITGPYIYNQIRNSFIADSKSTDDDDAVATLPISDPANSNNYWTDKAMAKSLGLVSNDATIDGIFNFGAGYNYSFDPQNRAVPGKYDFIGVAMHEISEIMGRVWGLSDPTLFGSGIYMPFDLFRYNGAGTRGLNTGGGNYFSINNGNTNLKDFNDRNTYSGDADDWAVGSNDAFNAFSSIGVINDLTPVDIRVMDVIGYDLIKITSVVSGGGTVCSGTTLPNVSINFTGQAPWTFTYSNGNNQTTVTANSNNPYIINGAAPGIYTITALSNACSTAQAGDMTGSAIVAINSLPLLNSFFPLIGSSGTLVSINGSGFTNVSSVKFNGLNTTYVVNSPTQISAIVPSGASTGYVTVTTFCGICTSSTLFTLNSSTVNLNLKLYIEGYFVMGINDGGTDPFFPSTQMRPCLYLNQNAGTIPNLPFPQGPYAATDCDYLEISAMNSLDGSFLESQTGLLQTDGTVNVTFVSISPSLSYYIRIRHRNALETWSSGAVDFSLTSPSSPYDFTTTQTQAYSSDYGSYGMHQMENGKWALLSGDMGNLSTEGSQDGNIDLYDFNFWYNTNAAFDFGYFVGDLNGDVNVDLYDFNYWDVNNAAFEYVQRPF